MEAEASLLIIEDEPGPTLALKTILQPHFKVYTADRGVRALAILQERAIDVVTLDLRMPGLSGIPLLEKIKSHDSDIEVVIITGYGSLETAVEGIRLDVYAYVSKPFDADEVLTVVNRALQKRRAKRNLRRSQEDFLASVSHEFRTPLGAIMGYSAMLLEEEPEKLSDRQREVLDRIQRNSVELLSYVEGIFYISSLKSGEVPVVGANFDAASVIEKRMVRLREQFDVRGIALEADIAESPLWVFSNEEMFVRVAETLILNSLKFTDRGRVTVRVAKGGSGSVVLTVEDTGIGMTPREVKTIRNGFKRTEVEPKRRYRGLGLGHAVIKEILSFLGGSIELDSRPGEGTKFKVAIPRLSPQASAAASAYSPHQPAGEAKESML